MIGTAVAAGAGLLSGAFSGIGANKRQKRAIAAQKEENELARKFNAEQSELSFQRESQFAEKMYNKNNDYNSTAAQRSRLAAAGVNPDLVYGSGSGLTPAQMASAHSSPASTSASDMASPIMGTPTMGESLLQGLSAAKMVAETDQIRTDTDKAKGEMTSIDLDNIRKAATTGAMIEVDNMQVTLSKDIHDLNQSQLQKLSAELNNLKTTNDQLNATIERTKAETANLGSQTALNRLQAAFTGPRFENECKDLAARLRESDSRINLNKQQVERLVIMTAAEKLNMDADTLLKNAGYHNVSAKTETEYYQQDLIQIEGANIKFDLQQKESWDSTERGFKIANESLHSISHLLDAVVGVVPGGSALKGAAKAKNAVKGFGKK